jgi:hypothetical protein
LPNIAVPLASNIAYGSNACTTFARREFSA